MLLFIAAIHKVHTVDTWCTTVSVPSYLELGPPPPLPLASVPSPLEAGTKGRGGEVHTRLRVRGWGSPNLDDWRESLVLCLLCVANIPVLWALMRMRSLMVTRGPAAGTETTSLNPSSTSKTSSSKHPILKHIIWHLILHSFLHCGKHDKLFPKKEVFLFLFYSSLQFSRKRFCLSPHPLLQIVCVRCID